MTDATIHRIGPADMSGLAHAQPVPPPYRPAICHTVTQDCTHLRVQSADPAKRSVAVEIITEHGSQVQIWEGLPREIIVKLVSAFRDGKTLQEGE